MATDTNQYFGFTDPTTNGGEFNRLRFIIQQQMMGLNTSMPVRVLSVNATGVAPVGFVSIQILVDQITGNGMTVPHGEIPNVPYFRYQGGENAVIIDPAIGDIGLACFCSRDISSVKNARKSAPPGSRRSYDFSDAMYVGGFLNKAPTQYIHFTSGGILIHSNTAVHSGNVEDTVRKLVDERMVTLFNAHTHTSGGPGGATSAPNQTMGAGQLTQITKAN